MKKATFVMIVLALVVMTVSAFAGGIDVNPLEARQGARNWAMGGTGIATSFDANAIDYNPANLGMLNIGYEGQPASNWQFQGAATVEVDGDFESWQTNWAANPVNDRWGIGASYYTADFGSSNSLDMWSFGIGWAYSEQLSFGAKLSDIDMFGDGENYISVGAAWDQGLVKFGFVIEDITDKIDGPYYNAGASKQLTDEVLIAADAIDITDEFDRMWGAGVEYAPMSMPNLNVRAGMYEGGNMTFGAGWDAGVWAVDASYTEFDFGPDDSINVSFSYKF